MVSPTYPDLWALALDRQQIGPQELAQALEREAGKESLDFRTRLLIRDSLDALRQTWGKDRLDHWLHRSSRRGLLEEICRSPLGEPGFPSLAGRIMEPTRAETVLQFLRELGQSVTAPTTIAIGGSASLILARVLSRRTEDIDIVDEVPIAIRSQHELLEALAKRYGLRLAHFQSHYLPTGWESRLHTLDPFGRLEIRLVDIHDVFLGKLFSNREKDLDDVRALAPQMDRSALARQFLETTASLRSEPRLFENAEKNWYIVFGEALPQA